MREQRSHTDTYCFTPLVTLLTFSIEWTLAAYVFARYRSRPIGKLATVFLVLLGTFQIAEYAICTTGNALAWTRIAFAAITFLPVIGLHLIAMLTGPMRWLWGLYAFAAGFVAVIVPFGGVFSEAACPGNFVLFTNHPIFSAVYGTYYIGLLMIGVLLLVLRAQHPASRWMLAGYLSFTLPTFLLYILFPAARVAVPSVLCGFAVLLALIIAFRVLPLDARSRTPVRHS